MNVTRRATQFKDLGVPDVTSTPNQRREAARRPRLAVSRLGRTRKTEHALNLNVMNVLELIKTRRAVRERADILGRSLADTVVCR
jgi:hypothetical protein